MKNVLIFGASGHGSVVLDCLERSKEYRVVGFVDSFIKKGTKKFGYDVLGLHCTPGEDALARAGVGAAVRVNNSITPGMWRPHMNVSCV